MVGRSIDMRILFVEDNIHDFTMFNTVLSRYCPHVICDWIPQMLLGRELLSNIKNRYELVVCDVLGTASPQNFWDYYRDVEGLCNKSIVTSGGDVTLPEWFHGEFVNKANLMEYLKLIFQREAA
jgi:hypothetical protein